MNKNLNKKIKIFSEVLKAIPEIAYIGDPVLRSRSKNVSLKEGIRIGKKLGEVLVKYRKIAGFGRGLAAPQIGLNSAVFVTFVEDKIEIYINPKIIKNSKRKNYFRELCLSSGFTWADVKRSESVTLEWMSVDGKTNKKQFDSFMARLIQHEYSHLQGEVNLDVAEKGSIEFAGDPLLEKLR